jgi:signal transduction histidine kinase
MSWDTAFFAPLVYRGRASGVIVVCYEAGHEPTEDEVAFLKAVADQAAVAVENARLYREAHDKAALEERQRLARELHDAVSQSLYGISLGAKTARTHLDHDPSRAAEPLDYVLSLSEAGLSEMKALIFELRPGSLEKEGLTSALEKLATALGERHQTPIHTNLCEEPNISLQAKESAYRISKEALHNTVKYARANKAALKLECGAEDVVLEIRDDGVGFDTSEYFPGHLGLVSMRERATIMGGRLEIESTPGEGTRMRAQIPLQ